MHSELCSRVASPALLALSLGLTFYALAVFVLPAPADAQNLPAAARPFVEVAPLPFRGSNDSPVEIRGLTQPLAPHLSASYGLGPADETALSASFLRYDQTLAFGTRSDGASNNNWRHFLGLQYEPTNSFSLVGGIAKAGGLSGGKGTSLAPSGYERLRLNAGARLKGDRWGLDGWAVDSSFSFIPTGATRLPYDANFMPGMGDSGPTWLFALTFSRRF